MCHKLFQRAVFGLVTLVFLSTIFITNVKNAEATLQHKTLNVAMTAAFVSENGVGIYSDISQYLEKKTGMKVSFVSNLSYSTVNKLIENGVIDVAFVCGLPYVLMNEKPSPKVALLAAPVMSAKQYQEKPVYYSYVIVPKDSTVRTFKELKGKVFVYNDTISNSGYNMPRKKLIDIGETKGFFSKVLHSGAHEESIRMVAAKQADASAVDSLVFDYASRTGEPYTKKVKIIEMLGPVSTCPVIYAKKLPPSTVEKLRQALLGMEFDPEGKMILAKGYLKRFVKIDDRHYDDIRAMLKASRDKHFPTIK